MGKTIKARFLNGVFMPLERVEVEEGKEVAITVSEFSRPKADNFIAALRATAGGWRGLIDAEELKRNIYADRLISTRPKLKIQL
ncbi:MAG: antitoxin family protein [Methanophagales archaeon]|nr:antitoxin family protein [Methanophagales archaeon]